jgi:hypothetical protein
MRTIPTKYERIIHRLYTTSLKQRRRKLWI